MRPRSKAGGKPVKTRRRKTKAAHLDKSPAAREETEVVRLRRELDEALERQTATAKVLSVIASSPHAYARLNSVMCFGLMASLCISQPNLATHPLPRYF